MIHISRPRRMAAVALLQLATAVTAGAQRAEPRAPDVDSLGSSVAPLITRREVGLATGLAAATLALMPFDARLSSQLRAPAVQNSRVWHDGAVIFDWYGAPGAMYAGPVLALAGTVSRSPGVFDAGVHVTESYATAALVTFTLKGLAGRARPYNYTVDQETAYSFVMGRGFPHREPYSSFPSGHATGSFAFASAITMETARHLPNRARLVGVLAFGGAFLDGVSRVYRDTHWPSDVAAGALVGTISGIVVTRHQHAHPGNRLDALARRVFFAPAADGQLAVGVTRSF